MTSGGGASHHGGSGRGAPADCSEIAREIPAFLAGELAPLSAARVDAHLAHCASCQRVADAIGGGFAAARSSADHDALDDATLQRLVGRVVPPAAAAARARPPRLAWAAAVVGVAAVSAGLGAAAAVLLVAGPFSPGALGASPPGPPQRLRSGPALPPPVLSSSTFGDGAVRVLAEAGWRGEYAEEAGVARMTVDRGFAAFALAADSRIVLLTDVVDLELIGARAIVDVREAGATIAVASGRARVLRGVGEGEAIAAGQALRIVDGAPLVRPLDADHRAILDDAQLVAPFATRTAAPARAAKTDLAACSGNAQRVAGAGDAARAVDLYRSCIAGAPEAALADHMRYEMARLEAFTLARANGRTALAALAAGSRDREIARQARLSICELDVASAPCRARACLAEQERSADAVLADSARRLALRWQLASACVP